MLPLAVLSSIMALAAALFLNSATLASAAAGATLAALWIVYRDLIVVGDRLEALATGQPDSTPDVVTELGAFASDQVTRISTRLRALAWQSEAPTVDAPEIPHDEAEQLESWDRDPNGPRFGASEARFFERAIETVRRGCRANTVYIVLSGRVQPSPEALHMVRVGSEHGKRFEKLLGQYLIPALRRESDRWYGLHDAQLEESRLNEFTYYGYRYSVTYPIQYTRGDLCYIGVLWLGYSAEMPPAEADVRRAQEYARRIENELRAQVRLVELSHRVNQAEGLDKERSDFIAQMSHDIRSPLNNVKAVLGLLEREHGRGQDQELFRIARTNCDNMAEIVEDILDLSRHRAGKLLAQPAIMDLVDCVEGVFESYRITARTKGLRFDFEAGPEHCFVHADRRHIKRIVSNLLSNALKYTTQGGVSVGITSDAQRWRVWIRDTGSGLSSDQISRLFTPFTRFHQGSVEGIGLGLALSKILVALNRGEVSVVSEQGRGSEFSVLFQQVTRDEASLSGPAGTVCQQVRSVLVVDDDRDCVESLARVLTAEGCQVTKAYSVAEAQAVLKTAGIGALITDVHMPGGGGQALVRSVASLATPIPVIILSGAPEAESAAILAGYTAPACALTKPVEVPELMRALNRLVC